MKIYLDIMTLPNPGMYTELLMAKTKDPSTPARWRDIKDSLKEKKEVEQTALVGSLGRTYIIGFAMDDGPPTYLRVENATKIYMKPDYEKLERQMLLDFFDFVNTATVDGEQPFFVGHNLIGFHLRFLWQRSVLLDIDCPQPIRSAINNGYRYPRNCYDTMLEWSGVGRSCSFDLLSRSFEATDGGDIDLLSKGLFYEFIHGDDRCIASKNMKDVKTVRSMYKRMSGRDSSGV